ncbi:MAG TPA: TIM-barrel domain-containing protein [Verrucomicrobiae bacterium]|nr:TIM-barrel domain-containing protein [Verrucomicrobiae bacterium]
MKNLFVSVVLILLLTPGSRLHAAEDTSGSGFVLQSQSLATGAGTIAIDQLFFETENGRVEIPIQLGELRRGANRRVKTSDGREVRLTVDRQRDAFMIELNARPSGGILKWGLSIAADPAEYFTGLMERVVDGPQAASWAPGIKEAMDLRGQKIDMILKPTTSVYAPYYISSRGYATFVQGSWPGRYDFCASDSKRVKLTWEGPSFAMKVYTAKTPAELVKAHALDAGPPFLPPKWMFTAWRWRDEHVHRDQYYDGTPVTGPFNSEIMEDVLLMEAYGIPCGVYWVDRPWGPGRLGYDDFEIDEKRLPNFERQVKWLEGRNTKSMLWIGPFFQGDMETNALKLGYNLAGQRPHRNNYPMVDFTNPRAKKYWQEGVANLLEMGVAGFKLDRAEEDIPESGPFKVFDGRSIRENRNAYPAMYVKATYEIAKKHRGGNDFLCMPRAAYTGSSRYGVFWGGDVGGTQEGLRASIIAMQRSAVMGYPNWGADTCGYNQQLMETEVCGRWLAFSCFNPIMEVGPTRNRAFWNFHNPPRYDAELIAIWRLYARLHTRLIDYGYAAAKEATKTGMPIVRPLFLVDPQAPEAWANWWTFQYGPDILVSAIWQKGQRAVEVYLPAGQKWQDAWNPGKAYDGGQTITVPAELHQIPIFTRAGSKVDLGDLHQEWRDAEAVASTRPDLKKLDAQLRAWYERTYSQSN